VNESGAADRRQRPRHGKRERHAPHQRGPHFLLQQQRLRAGKRAAIVPGNGTVAAEIETLINNFTGLLAYN
jgi:hypothetical protein